MNDHPRGLHLHAVHDEPSNTGQPQPCFAVIQRENGHWSTAACIRSVYETEPEAEAESARLKVIWPEQAFGVFSLRSEAVPTQKPVEIARVAP